MMVVFILHFVAGFFTGGAVTLNVLMQRSS